MIEEPQYTAIIVPSVSALNYIDGNAVGVQESSYSAPKLQCRELETQEGPRRAAPLHHAAIALDIATWLFERRQ
jgi:hypothetical protein